MNKTKELSYSELKQIYNRSNKKIKADENLYVLISVKDIEEVNNTYSVYKKASGLMKLIDKAKQISLSEEDIEEKVWEFVKPAENALHPENSDGYNEFEVYNSIKQAIKSLI